MMGGSLLMQMGALRWRNLVGKGLAVLILSSLAAPTLWGEEFDQDVVLDTIAQMNHMNWVVTKIKNYNNALVLEEEYEKISPGMLNLNRIPDAATLEKIKNLLDELHAMRKNERDMQYWREHLKASNKQRQLRYWKDQVETIAREMESAPLQVARLCATYGSDGGAWVSLAKTVANTTLGQSVSYAEFMDKLQEDADRKVFEFESDKLERMHVRNKAMLEDQWKLIRKYKLDDSVRVVESDLVSLIEMLKDPAPSHVYPRILPLRSRFPTFPVYWYYLSSAAVAAGDFTVGLEACDTFFKVNRGLFRDDPMAGIVALNKAVVLEKTDANREEIRRCLELYWRMVARNPDWEKDYVCAGLFSGYLQDLKMAKLVLDRAIANLESGIERDFANVNALAASENPVLRFGEANFPDGEALLQCRTLHREIERGGTSQPLNIDFGKIGRAGLIAPIEELDYLGRLNANQLYEAIGPDLENVAMRWTMKVKWTDLALSQGLTVTIPLRWFLSGNFKAQVRPMSGTAARAVLHEVPELRRALRHDLVALYFPIEKKALNGVDSLILEFPHPRSPYSLTFASASAYVDSSPAHVIGASLARKFADDRQLEDLTIYEMTVGEKRFRRVFGKTGVQAYSDSAQESDWREAFSAVFTHLAEVRKGVNVVNRSYVANVDLRNDKVVLNYKNDGEQSVKPAVSVFLLNRYGTVVQRIDDVWRFSSIQGKEEEKSERSHSCNLDEVKYIDVEIGD